MPIAEGSHEIKPFFHCLLINVKFPWKSVNTSIIYRIEASKDTTKVLQAQMTKKQRELDKTKAELLKKTLILEQVQTSKLEVNLEINVGIFLGL